MNLSIIVPFLCIIFLTGCAKGRYDISTPEIPKGSLKQGHLLTGDLRFSWPLNGDTVSTAKGIVIESRGGGAVKAAQAGRVALVHNSMKGYGKTILVEHSEEFSTLYARNNVILVQPGQWVSQGEVIAKPGPWGEDSTPQVYFEVRKNSKAENPLHYLVSP